MSLLILQQLFILYIFIIIGWLLGKSKAGKTNDAKILSVLLVNVFLPCKVFSAFSENLTLAYIKENTDTLIVSGTLLLFLLLLSMLFSRVLTKQTYQQKVYRYSLTISNYAYMGYSMAEALFGSMGLTNFIMFCIPFTLYTYTFGYAMLTKTETNLKKGIFKPMMIAIFVGSIFGISGIQLPSLFKTFFSNSAVCASIIGMLLTGLTLSAFSLKTLFLDKTSYIFVALRLLALPLIVGFIFRGLGLTEVLPMAVLFSCMPCGLNPIVFAKLVGEDCQTGASIVVLSHLFSIFTIPICLSVLL